MLQMFVFVGIEGGKIRRNQRKPVWNNMSEDQLTFLTASLKENDEVDEKRIYLFDSMSGCLVRNQNPISNYHCENLRGTCTKRYVGSITVVVMVDSNNASVDNFLYKNTF